MSTTAFCSEEIGAVAVSVTNTQQFFSQTHSSFSSASIRDNPASRPFNPNPNTSSHPVTAFNLHDLKMIVLLLFLV